jgi:glutamine---fructose-6-phosphate transaminase (isomerizing)
MCGIVGYMGKEEAAGVLVSGLKKLEYRGYDSAGVAVVSDNGIHIRKAVGKLQELENVLAQKPLRGGVGLGHTRWATHGVPSMANAHPHVDFFGRTAVVHNGIIENHAKIREKLSQKGVQFVSETD